jgi:competence protein ComEC
MPVFVFLAAGWLLGIWLAPQLNQPAGLWLLFAGLAAGSLALLWPRRRLRLALAVCAALGLGAARYEAARPPFGDAGFLATYNETSLVVVEAIVWGEPEYFETHTRLRVRATAVLLPETNQRIAVNGLALVHAPRYLEARQARAGDGAFRYGDRLRLAGQLQTPPVLDGFSYRDYLARRGIHSQLRTDSIIFVEAGAGPRLAQALYNFKARGLWTLARIFPEPHAALLQGILLGTETGIPPDLKEDFNITSTSHIVAISGFNIAILAGLITAVTYRLYGPYRGTLWAVGVIAIYTLLVGAQGSVVRAAIMGSLALLAARLGRRAHGLNTLAASGVLMTLFDPAWLWDVGFQLSAAATLGLVLYAEPFTLGFQRLVERVTTPSRARRTAVLAGEVFLFTLAAQITTLPYTLLYFGRFSVVSLLANLIILPAQPAVMLAGGLALLLGLIWLPLGQLAAWAAWPFTAYTISFVQWLAKWPGAAFKLGEVTPAVVAVFFTALFGLTWAASTPAGQRPAWLAGLIARRGRALGLLALGILTLLVWSWYFSLPERDDRLRVLLLDISVPGASLSGGEAILVQTPGGSTLLVNGGPGGRTLTRGLDQRLPLFDRRLDLLVVAGRGSEHIGGLPELLERYRAEQAVVTGAEAPSAAYQQLSALLQQQGVKRIDAGTLPTFDLGDGISLRVLADTPSGSLLRLERGSFSLLMPPRLDARAEAELLASGLIEPASVLLLSANGSNRGNTEAWLRAVSPQIVLISAGAGRSEPSSDVLARLADQNVLRTDQHGTITLETDGEQVWVRVER